MSMTLEQLRNQLSAIEPYEGMYAGIGPEEIPLLAELVQDEEVWMASRAVFALSRVQDVRTTTVLAQAIDDPRPEVRVAVAASIQGLPAKEANSILPRLLTDADQGVRKFAIQSVNLEHSIQVMETLEDIQFHDPAAYIREAARSRLNDLELNR